MNTRILELIGAASAPVPTTELVKAVGDGRPNMRQRVWKSLIALQDNGLIRPTVTGAGGRTPQRWELVRVGGGK
jgi:hypothetical protein